MLIFIRIMESEMKRIKSKRLKFIRAIMYFDVLLLLLSMMMIDIRDFSLSVHSGWCLRILVLAAIFIVLLIAERSLSHYLRKHRGE